MLDGLEIFKALTHLMPYEDMDPIGDQVDVTGKSADQIRTEKKALRIKYYTGKHNDGTLLDSLCRRSG